MKLKAEFNKIVSDNVNKCINSQSEWGNFTSALLKSKLAKLVDIEKLEKVQPSFPLTFETLMNTINQAFGDQQLKTLSWQFDEAYEQLENVRTLINMMNIKFLKHEELKQLAHFLHSSHQKSIIAEQSIKKILDEVKGQSEDVYGYVWDKIITDYKKIKLPHEFVRQEKANLEREFVNRRVRTVHYRK